MSARDQILDEGQQRIEQILGEASLRIERVLDEIENTTGVRPGPLSTGRGSVLDAGWAKLLHHRDQCLHLLNVIDDLAPFMDARSGGLRATSVEAALKTMPADVAGRVIAGLRGAGLVELEGVTPR
ncbi:hypothetical protein [Streptomyces sp. ID05-47C]|uniref:hypothetical protein n=1 Tax=Streptomyces sp. ID05-47C TaxID=3028665 RepID=UPI0029BB0D4D|nr:hypothetical protein [Streptomyces sp. ID05-47C]MDX3570810.1 hypothetical protein [Streptomyces sp. ID05-47C]